MGLNAFVFQVVARGDAMYPSSRLPWSVRLGGAGVDPGYDPLAVAVDECHRLGMELHAWINTFRIGDVATVAAFENVTEPGHVYYEQPGWVETYNNQLWLDPSSAEARSWLAENVMEIVDGYDIDAVHFDFIRYPSGGLQDDLASFQFDPRGFSEIEDWRRNNITLFVNDVSQRIFQSKPWVKVGSAPFGNYESFDGAWPAAWAFSDVFQESRRWLSEGTHDYMAPQIYFDIGREPEPPNSYDSPDFAYLIDEWVAESANRPIFAGHGPYKSVVFEELDTQIARARSGGAAGQVFFRFDHIRGFDFTTSYPGRALPAPMRHRFEFAPPPMVAGLIGESNVLSGDSVAVVLTWNESSGTTADPLAMYAIFASNDRDPNHETGEDLLATVWRGATTYTDNISTASANDRRYVVVALSRLGAASPPSTVVSATPVGTSETVLTRALAITAVWPVPATDVVNITIEPRHTAALDLTVFDVLGRQVRKTTIDAIGGQPVTHTLDVDQIPGGVYFLVARDGTSYQSRRLVIAR